MCSKVVETVEAKCGTEAQLRSEGRVVSKFWEVCLSLVSISIMAGHGAPFQVQILSMLPWYYWQLEMLARDLCQCLQPLVWLL